MIVPKSLFAAYRDDRGVIIMATATAARALDYDRRPEMALLGRLKLHYIPFPFGGEFGPSDLIDRLEGARATEGHRLHTGFFCPQASTRGRFAANCMLGEAATPVVTSEEPFDHQQLVMAKLMGAMI